MSTPDSDFDQLRSRYAEAESKRRRADALADGLAQRVAALEAELRARAPTGSGDDGRKRLEARIVDLEGQIERSRAMLASSEAANAALDEKAAVARARADAAEEALARLEERAVLDEEARASEARDLNAARDARARAEARVAELEAELSRARGEVSEARERQSVTSLDAETKLAQAEERAQRAEAARAAESTAATEARARLASASAKASESALRVTTLEQELARARSEAEHRQKDAEAKLRSLEAEKSELTAKLATTTTKLGATEAKVATLQSMASELDQALQRERVRAAEIEAGQRRVQTAAVSSVREILSRLERHEGKLAALRKDALHRAVTLLDEAGGVHGAAAGDAGRLTPSIGSARPVIAVAAATSAKTAPGAPRPATMASASRSEPGATPVDGSKRTPKRTMQGLTALPRGAFESDAKSPTKPPPRADDSDIEISVDAGEE